MTFTATLEEKMQRKLEKDLREQDFEFSKPPHTMFSAKKEGISVTLYQSGKLVVQGKNSAEFIEFYLEPHILMATADLEGRIGCDEAGKGDFFGPLCVAGVYASDTGIQQLVKMGVKDSKGMKDDHICRLAKKIEQEFPHQIVKINPLKYNELYEKFGNLNTLLAWAHSTVIEQLSEKTGCKRIIVDQFAHESVLQKAVGRKKLDLDLIQRTKGESDVVVAAGSILARKTFVEAMDWLEKKWGMRIPKGGGALVNEAGREFVKKYSPEQLAEVAKLHFKNRSLILGS